MTDIRIGDRVTLSHRGVTRAGVVVDRYADRAKVRIRDDDGEIRTVDRAVGKVAR